MIVFKFLRSTLLIPLVSRVLWAQMQYALHTKKTLTKESGLRFCLGFVSTLSSTRYIYTPSNLNYLLAKHYPKPPPSKIVHYHTNLKQFISHTQRLGLGPRCLQIAAHTRSLPCVVREYFVIPGWRLIPYYEKFKESCREDTLRKVNWVGEYEYFRGFHSQHCPGGAHLA